MRKLKDLKLQKKDLQAPFPQEKLVIEYVVKQFITIVDYSICLKCSPCASSFLFLSLCRSLKVSSALR